MQLTESETPMWDLDFATRLDLFRQYKIFSVRKMARNKRKKNMKDKSKFKALRIEAKKRWRNKRAEAKRLKHAVEHAAVSPEAEKCPIAVGENGEPNPAAALVQPVEPLISRPQEQPDHA